MAWQSKTQTYLKLKQDIRNIENRQQPLILIRRQIQILLHACNFRIADVSSIQKREQNYRILSA
jgi:hypothetical protein